MYEREGGANNVLLIHSISVVAFILFSLLYVQYTYPGLVTNLTSSAVIRIKVSSE